VLPQPPNNRALRRHPDLTSLKSWNDGMSEREDPFDLGTGWPPWKGDPPDNRSFAVRAMSEPVNRIASFVVIGAMIGGLCSLCLLWCWWLSIYQRPIVDAAASSYLTNSPQLKLGGIANSEIKSREGWTGKVILADQQASTWHIWVEREPAKQADKREIRQIDIDGATRKVLKYIERDPSQLPDAAAQ